MPAVHALGQALDVQRSTAQGIVAPARPAPVAASARTADRVTLSSAARALAAGCGPCEGEPTDLEGARATRAHTPWADSGRTAGTQAPPEPSFVDLFA